MRTFLPKEKEQMMGFTLSLALLTAGADIKAAPAEVPAVPQVRSTIERSLGFLEAKGVAWLDKQGCIACHHGAWMVWSFSEARRAGIKVDAKKFDALAGRVVKMYLAERAEHEKKKNGWVESTYMLLSRYDDPSAEWRRVAAALIVAGQRGNGSWPYAGQGLDLPNNEAEEATTLWAILALPEDSKAEAASRDKALAWLKQAKPGSGHDSAALRLAVELRFGDRARARALTQELLARQNADGGWNWSKKRPPSDAFATGESLYALSLAGVKGDSPAVQKAWNYLLTTQRPDGSWQSASRKPSGGNQVASYWATAWATIGLSQSLPRASK
jgi:hypothetical protein